MSTTISSFINPLVQSLSILFTCSCSFCLFRFDSNFVFLIFICFVFPLHVFGNWNLIRSIDSISYMMSSMSSSSSAADVFLSEEDIESMKFKVLVTSSCEFSDESQVLSSEDEHELSILEAVHQSNDHQQQSKAADNSSCLKINTPPHFEEFDKVVVVLHDDVNDEGDGFRTPTSLQERLPVSLPACPPAPRKRKSLRMKKRKAHETQITLTDDSEEIQSFFALAVFTDLGGGGKTKRFRSENFL